LEERLTRPRGLQLADYVRELTEPHQHTEAYTTRERTGWVGRRHTTRVPALLDQLWDAPSNQSESGSASGYESRPVARKNDSCDATWDESTIGLLADHIRAESEAERVTPAGVGPCWCPWPKPTVPDFEWQCPRCGSVVCTHALRRRLLADVRAAAS
jgi:hypothetical protein